MASRLPELLGRARDLCAERDRLVEAVAERWVAALRGQRLSSEDLDELWAGLTEAAVSELLRDGGGRWAPEAVRLEAAEVITRVRQRVERALTEAGDGSADDA
ncbi:MAG: hypothetical protein HY613_03315 [Candidatus Rokubacteria bacterium]|nr:hypothetical protein [Candidatus Rokubacteria bacterium]